MKKALSVIILCCFAAIFTGCNNKNYEKNINEDAFYKKGLELVAIIDEMVKSEEYSLLMDINISPEIATVVNTNDYDCPTAVYKIVMPNTEKILALLGVSESEQYNQLSDNLKKQIKNKISFSSITAIINGKSGSTKLAFASTFTAADKHNIPNLKEPVTYIYFFEKGTPIAVTFNDTGYANAQFIFIEGTDDFSEAVNALSVYGFSIEKIR